MSGLKICCRLMVCVAAMVMLSVHGLAQYRIAGHVVSAIDGRPLRRATVEILEPGGSKLAGSTISGETGEFAFSGVKAGAYVLEGEAPGYVGSRYDAHGQYSTAIVTGAGVDTESLKLKLKPEADLSGRVTDEMGEPVRHANVALYREDYLTGEKRIVRAGGAQTDDAGAYDLAHLAPGRYFLSASATPWYAVYPQTPRQGEPLGVVDSIDPSLNVAYATTFYPGATDSSAAAPIEVKGGDQMELSLQLIPQTAATITVARSPNEPLGRQEVELQRQVFDGLEQVGAGRTASATEYTFAGLAPGHYVVRQMGPESGSAGQSAKVNLTQWGEQVDPGAGEALGKVKAVLKTADGGKMPQQTAVALILKDAKDNASQMLNEEGEVTARGLKPGEYYFVISVGNQNYFVTHLESDGKTLPGNRLVVTAGASLSVTVTASPASGTVKGFAKSDGKAAAGAMVIMLPSDPFNRMRYAWRDQSDLDGSFHLSNIPPGSYTLLAIQDGWELEWQHEDVVAHYLALGVPVIVPGGAGAGVKLAEAVVVQAR